MIPVITRQVNISGIFGIRSKENKHNLLQYGQRDNLSKY